ncbi:hypothetical protein KFK09_020560 [Dendrobium nobile]|uniref:Protein NRT1/ PTR FAMILY 5.10-like n=1 Tax=Dendrobium nobile TaxID=94219 RepID=A0A8T3AM70_DENNO|nr:hypothetical protein KFK09_020560 [Dendrobium nobile]
MESYPLLGNPVAMAGVLDYKGRPITKTSSGRWVAASFILAIEMAERVAYNGIVFNLISYMTGPLGESTVAAASAVSVWSGVTLLLPILGALVADSFLSRYRTIVISSFLYVLGLGLLSLSAVLPNLTTFKSVLFYFSFYIVAIAEGGHRPCVQAFGADQFDETDESECKWRSSFFNWWIFGLAVALTASPIVLSYIQDNVNWALGFGIPCILLGSALIVFLMGSRFYRCYTFKETSPYGQVSRAFVNLVKRKLFSDAKSEAEALVKNYPVSPTQPKLQRGGEDLMTEQMELETKSLLHLFPIWATCLFYSIINCQWETFFTKQGATLDRNIISNFHIPAAGLQSLSNLSVTILIVFYDRLAVPLTRNITGIPSGITMLQRIGIGLLLSVFVMVISALVEMKRLETAIEFDLVDKPNSVLPMSILWLFPQYILMGLSSVFATVGLQEFFYDQVPDSLRSFGIAICLSIFGIGSLINSFLIYVTDKVTTRIGGESWFSNNLNRAHLDYFYWLIACMEFCSFVAFVHYGRCYVYKTRREIGV